MNPKSKQKKNSGVCTETVVCLRVYIARNSTKFVVAFNFLGVLGVVELLILDTKHDLTLILT